MVLIPESTDFGGIHSVALFISDGLEIIPVDLARLTRNPSPEVSVRSGSTILEDEIGDSHRTHPNAERSKAVLHSATGL